MEEMIQASDGNPLECSEATKTILEDVCMDFESMDVVNPKSSKFLNILKSRPDSSRKSSSAQNKSLSSGTVSTVAHSTNMLDVQNKSNSLPPVGNIFLNTVAQNEASSAAIALEQSENDLLQQSYCAAVGHTTSAIEANSETGISFISGDFSHHNENIPSMAQLADAEIIQTDENSVSIIITNPRLIKVMSNADNSLSSAMVSASMIDPSASMLESAIGVSEQYGVIDSSEISTFKIEDIGLSDNTPILNNIYVETEAEISNPEISNVEVSNSQINNEKQNKRGRPPKKKDQPSAPVKKVGKVKAPKLAVVSKPLQLPRPRPAAGTTTKARRITAKMKDAWSKQLQKTGCLVCHVPGCSQTYVTVANFATHFKYCTGKKNLQHCLYCDSLIFSSNKAVLQHMEVEHPDKVEEYKAKYPEACAAYDEGSLPSHLIVAEDENVAMNVEEVTQPQRKKRKLSSKENVLSPPRTILKHKMKCINESVNENIKEFKKCVRFDNIVDKINSVDEFTKVVENVTEIKSPKKPKKKRVYVTGKIVAEKEYFRDDDDIGMTEEEQEEAQNREMMHTKARMVLNLERYKRYKEYLKLTRDWSSERKTYSRSRGSDTSLDTSYLIALQNEYLQDVHQLHATEDQSANISLDISQITDSQLELNTTPNDLTPIQTFEVIQTDKFVSVQPIQSHVRSNITSTPISQDRNECANNLSLSFNEVSSVAIDLPVSSHETTKPRSFLLNKERVPCYNRPGLPSNVVCKTETPRPNRCSSAITFGVAVPVPAPTSKPPEPVITFDTLRNLTQKQVNQNSQSNSDKIVGITCENNNHVREDGNKQPAILVDLEQKKGRLSNSNPNSVIYAKTSQNKLATGKNKNNSKKHGATILKSIKNNVRNRNVKLLKLKNSSKLKCDSKKIIRLSQLRTNRINLRNAQQKTSHQNLSSVNNTLQDLEKVPEEESVVQCMENIDNHISLTGNIAQIECFTADHNYSHPIDICSVDPINNIAGEVEITSSNIEDVGADKINISSNIDESVVAEPVASNLNTQEVETVNDSAPNVELKKGPDEFLKVSQELEFNSEPSVQNESISANAEFKDRVVDIQVAESIMDISSAENVTDIHIAEKINTDTQVAEKIGTNTQIAEKVNDDISLVQEINAEANEIDNDAENLKNGAEIAEKINTDAESIGIDAKLSEKIVNDAEIMKVSVTDAEIVNVTAHIPEKFDTGSEIVKEVDINTQSVENEDMDTERFVTDTQKTDHVISNLVISNSELVEKKSIDACMEDSPTVLTADAEINKAGTVSGPLDDSEPVPLNSDSHVISLSGDAELKKNDLVENSTSLEVQGISTELVAISISAQATSVQNERISADASDGNNTESEKLSLNDESKSKEHTATNEVNTDDKKSKSLENSEANEKSNVLEVKVKRGRGRPKKTQCKVVPAQNNSETDAKVKSKKVDDSAKKNETQEENSVMLSSIEENRFGVGLRKSERVKKRKLVEEEPVKSKVETPKEVVPSTPVLKTGKRGRPKKCPLKDSDTNPPVNDDNLKQKPSVIETEVVDENLRKFSRKGRPRKCVRYADLNSGIESSESLDGLNSGGCVKDKQDDTAVLKAENVQDAYEKEKQEEKILPLKKRKQRQSKKDESLDENASQEQDSESVSPDGKKIKIDENVETVKTTKSGRVLRTRKSTSKKYSDDYELDDPLDKDYEEKDDDLESDEIYHPADRSESSTRKWNAKFTRKLSAKMKDFKDKFSSQSKDVLPEFKPKKYMWKLLSGKDYYDFLPPLKNSVYFKIKKTWNDNETIWSSLRCFDSLPIDRKSSHITFFTGGPVLCSAWCPVPADSTQYIAVAVSSTLNKYHSYLCTDAEKGLIQLWNLGHLTDKLNHPKPIMELGISHNHGFISDMAWCPSGCWENPLTESTDGSLPRLGMLAVSCSDSYIRIYSIPHLSYLTRGPRSVSLYSPCPSVILKPLYGGECMATRKSMCVCLTWQKTDNCERIVGGYGNGMICIWLINSSATILTTKGKDQTIISPYLIFSAHGTPVTSVSFAPLSGARFLVSSSTDKTLKFWDLFDTSLPFFTVRKGASRYAEWIPNVCGAIASLDYGMCSWKGASFFKECGTENSSSRNCGKPCCSVRRSSLSEWINAQAIADLSGEVSVSFLNSLKSGDSRGGMFFCRLVYKAEMKIIEGEIKKLPLSNEPESGCKNPEEMQDVINVVNRIIEHCDTTLNLTSIDKRSRTTVIALNPKRCRKKRRRSELEAEEYCSESTEISQNCFEASDVISLITDTKDVISTMNNLVEKDFKIAEAQLDAEVCNILGNIVEEVERREERYMEISNILNNMVAEVTNVSEISSVLYNIVAEVIKSAEMLDILNNIVAEVTYRAEVSEVLNNIVADVIRKADVSVVLNNIVADVIRKADVSDVLNNIVADVNRRADVSVLLKNIVADVMRKTDVTDLLNNIVAEVTRKADVSYALNDMVADVVRKADVSDVLNDIVAEVINRADICSVLNNIVTEVRNRADICSVLNNIVTEVRNRAEISHILDKIVFEVKNRAEISDILNNIVFEINNRAEISVILNNIVSEVEKKAEISDVVNNIVADVDRKADIYDILCNIVEEVRNKTEISDVLKNIVSEVKNKVEISDVLNNIVAEVRIRAENEAEICNVLSNVVAEVGNRTKSEVEIDNLLNNIVAEVRNRCGNTVEISSVLSDIVAKVSTSLWDKNLKNPSKISVKNDLTNKMVLECPNKDVGPMEDTLPNSMDVEMYTNEVHGNFMLENEHSAAGQGKVSHNENLVEKSKCDESLTDFQMEYNRNGILLNKCITSCDIEQSQKCYEASALVSQTTDLVSLIADMKDLISTTAELTNSNAFPPELLSVFELDRLKETDSSLSPIDSCMAELKSYPKILSELIVECKTENSTSLTILDLLYSMVRKVSETIVSHPEIRKLSNGVANDMALKNSNTKEILIGNSLDSSLAKANVLKDFEDIHMGSSSKILLENDDCTNSSRLLNQCLDIRDLVSLVVDMKDIVSAMSQLAADLETDKKNKITAFNSLLLLDKLNVSDPIENSNCLLPNNSSQIISDILCKLVKTVDKFANHSKKKLCEDVLVSETSTAIKAIDQMESSSVESVQDEEMMDTELPSSFSGILEIVNLVADVKDVVSAASRLSSGPSILDRTEMPTFSSEFNLGDLPSEIPLLEIEQELTTKPCSDEQKENSEWEVVSEDIVNLLQNLVETVHTMTEKVACIGISNMECDKRTDIPLALVDEFKDSVAPESDLASNSLDSSQMLELAAVGDMSYSDTFNELTSVDSPSLPPMLTPCNNYVPHIVCEESLDNEPPELKNEIDDSTVMSVDGDSSSSENEMDTDDEIADYPFERESNFSGDSYLSECSLDSNSSISFSSGDSVVSESSSSPVPDEQDMEDSNLPPASQNSDNEKPHSEIPPSVFSLVSEIPSNLPTSDNLDKDVSSTVSENTEHLEVVSVSPPVEDSKVEESSKKLEENVPVSSTMDSSQSCLKPTLLSNNNSILDDNVNNFKETSVSLNCVEHSELVTDRAATDSGLSSLPNVNTNDILCQQSELSSEAGTLCADKSSDIQHSSNGQETVQVDRCNESCAVNIENNLTDSIDVESASQVIPESVKRNIFVSEELPDSSCTSINSVEILDKSTEESADAIPVSENKFSNKRLLTYENVIAEHGLVFKDMDTADFENIKDIPEERFIFPPFDMYHLASINTVSWNPNYGSHLWLFSAGQSGIARLSYVSEINREKYFRRN